MDETADTIATIRAFNRFYTGIIGLLQEGMHQSPYTLAEARLVYELGKRGAATGNELARELKMDRGQMSRLVWRLSDQGLLALTPGVADKRSSTIVLTRAGDAAFRALDTSSDRAASALIAPLDAFRRRDLVSSMRRIQTMLAEPEAGQALVLRPPHVGEIGWLIHRQGLLYHLEQGWNAEFETLVAKIYTAYQDAAGLKSLWMAEQGGEIAGSIFILPAEDEERTAQLRMLYVEPAYRGQGLGKRLVDEAVRFSRASGYDRIILWTQDCLVAARRIYQGAGFMLIREERHRSFGADLNGQYWALELKRG